MDFKYNKSWILFIGAEGAGKTYISKKLIQTALNNKVPENSIWILDPNDLYKDFPKAHRIIPKINEENVEFLDKTIKLIRSKSNILFIGDDIDIFLHSGYDSKEFDRIGKNIKQQTIGGILHTHRPKFFNSRIYQICDYVFIGFGLNNIDKKYLNEVVNMDIDLYNKVQKHQFLIIERDTLQQHIIGDIA